MERREWPCYLLFLSSSYLKTFQKTALTSLRGANNKTKRNLFPCALFLYAVKSPFLFHHFNTHFSSIKQDPKKQVLRHAHHTSILWVTSCTHSRSQDHHIQLVPEHITALKLAILRNSYKKILQEKPTRKVVEM